MTAEGKTKRSIHWPAVLDATMIYGGAIIIVLMVTYMAANPFEETQLVKRLQIVVVGVGLIINQIGVWHIASHVTSGRRYLALREEVDDFIDLVRTMNTVVLDDDLEEVERVKAKMHASIDRMISLAGREGPAAELRGEEVAH